MNSVKHRFPDIFFRVAKQTLRFLQHLKPDIDIEKVSRLYTYFRQPECPRINYREFSNTFAYTYFLMNFWKSARIFIDEGYSLPARILDIGSGSGAISLAYLAWIEHMLLPMRCDHHVDLFLVDSDERQMQLAGGILESARHVLNRASFKVHTLIMSASRVAKMDERFDTILMGHLLTENRSMVQRLLKRAVVILDRGGSLFIIERVDDPIWETIDEGVQSLGFECSWGNREFAASELPLIRPKGFTIPKLSARYLVLRKQRYAMHERLILSYFEAWRKQSVNLLKRIFAEDAQYHENPFEDPIRGLDSITKYWKDKVLRQKNPNPIILRTVYLGDDVIVEWRASYFLKAHQVNLRGAMILTIDVRKNKIQRLREYFIKKVS